jgi:hypothetical protein
VISALQVGSSLLRRRFASGRGTNWFAIVMSVAAFAALYRFKADALRVVLGGGLIELARALLGR